MAVSPAQRRLKRLETDPTYGPRLARMASRNRATRREVLALVEANRGREARQVINAWHNSEIEQRRAKRYEKDNARRRALRYLANPNRSGEHRPSSESAAFWRAYDKATG
jgi:hypothetical protein